MTLLDYLSRSTSQTVVAEAPAAPVVVSEAPELAPLVAVEEPKAETTTAAEPEVAAASVEPIKEETEVSSNFLTMSLRATEADFQAKQPTTTHAASGTAHSDAEVATKVDGTVAKPDPVAEVEEPVEAKKETVESEAPTTETAAVAAPAEGSKAVTVEDPKEKEKKAPVKVSFSTPFVM
jgi:hypothetical protein